MRFWLYAFAVIAVVGCDQKGSDKFISLSSQLMVTETSAAGPDISASSAASGGRDFGDQAVTAGATAPLTVVLRNTGSDTLSLDVPVLLSGNLGDFTIDATSLSTTLSPGEMTSFAVTFNPTSPGVKSVQVAVSNSATTNAVPRFQFEVKGRGLAPSIALTEGAGSTAIPAGSLPSNGRTFAARRIDIGASTPLVVTVTNGGTSTLTLGTPTLTGTTGDFLLLTTGFSNSVAAGATTSFSVAFDPVLSGSRSATVSLTHDALGGPATPFTFGI